MKAPAPIKALIVEDRPPDAELLVMRLKQAGFDVDPNRVQSEPEFIAALEQQPDIILSDYSLPQFSGLRALELLKQRRLDIPFVLVSGTIGEEVAVAAMKYGAWDYLLKDRLGRLGQCVQHVLDEARMRRERHRAEEALRESEAKFRELAENINEVFWITDPLKEQMVYVSPAYEIVWGRTCQSLYEDPRSWMDSIHPEDRQRVREAAMTKQAAGDYDEVYRIARPDGSLCWIRDRAYPLRNGDGKIYRIVGTAEDITTERSLEQRIQQAQKLESIGQLAAGVAHDFNNMLAVIRGNAELALLDEIGVDTREYLTQITAASERAASLTRQLLAFSHNQVIQPRLLNLNEVVGNMIKMLKRILGEDVALQVSYASNLPVVRADPGMMEQVVMNLAVNARDAMPRGGHLVITTSDETIDAGYVQLHPQAAMGDFVCLTVSDTGPGIAPEIQPRIFEPFFTTKGVGKGTGLGLATVYGIVRQHQGWINVYSEMGKGAVFRIYLPVVASGKEVIAERAAESELRGGNETILLAEDETSVRALVRNVLERYGYTVVEANSGVEALKAWSDRGGKFDLLFTDLVMPDGMTGRELAQKLQAEHPALQVIYTSGYSAEVVGREFELKEGINFLQKPTSARKLIQAVRNALDRKS